MNAVTPIVDAKIDPRYAFLVRASARLWLVDNCEMDIGDAFDDLVADLQCACSREIVVRWERDYPHRPQRRRS
jgi:hypothetical protein